MPRAFVCTKARHRGPGSQAVSTGPEGLGGQTRSSQLGLDLWGPFRGCPPKGPPACLSVGRRQPQEVGLGAVSALSQNLTGWCGPRKPE